VATGEATITATIDGVNGTATVTIRRIARPDRDIDNPGAWSPTPLWIFLDDNQGDVVSASICCRQEKSFTVGLSDVPDPQTSASHVIRARARISTSSSVSDFFRVELMQGAVRKATTTFWTDLSNTTREFAYTLTGAEADAITDYTDLRLRVVYTALQDGNWTAYVDRLEFEVP
jgi:hypothetical protein